ncbi:uncharacterized protein N7479_000638 [Penicillium vulpinum]|uniref:SnoaL-like domain-containing protein n=1 Tax=Penicillium vulpinum TaxID=29845 RepID=A0A1V6S4S1_9EURO|nr:uncharacterized protein N7479_000638 [Penicillium vulpinum]KAJ5970720.1 hypothetical protein N7479_000638 [Penicillium vulpinum]OQE09042.1 hypothetical protein PENVUL_c007G03276 [Penicillium vulpinum]
MSVTTTVVKGPLNLVNPPSIVTTNPILSWYAKYAVDYSIAKTTTPPTKYYASNATLVNTDRSIISGAAEIWDYYIELYGQFERCAHDLISISVLSDETSGKHTMIVQTTNNLHLKDGKGIVPLPQAFVYEIAEAEEGAGMDDLQIWEVKCYFDKGLLERAAST